MTSRLWKPRRVGLKVVVEERGYSSTFLGYVVEFRTGRYFTVGLLGWALIWVLNKLSRSTISVLRKFAEHIRLRTRVTYTYYQDQEIPDFSYNRAPAGRN